MHSIIILYSSVYYMYSLHVCKRAKSLQLSVSAQPMDYSLTDNSVYGIFQARILVWTGLAYPPPGDLPNPGIKPASLKSLALASRFFTTSTTWKAQNNII